MMFLSQVLLSHCVSKILIFIIGLQLQSTNGGLLDAVGILGNTLQTGNHHHTVPNLLNQVVGGVGTSQGNMVKVPNQIQQGHQATMQQRPNVNNYQTTASLNNQHVYPTQSYVTNGQRPNVAFQQQPTIVQHQNPPRNDYNTQNTGNTGQFVFIPHSTGQNYQQNTYPIAGNQNQLQNQNPYLQNFQPGQQNLQNGILNQNFGQNGLQHSVGQTQQINSGNLNNPLPNQDFYQNGSPTSNVGQFGNQNQVYNGQQGVSTGQQFQQPNNNVNYGGSLPPISSVIGSTNTGNINHNINGVQQSGNRNDGIYNNGHRNENKPPVKYGDEDSKVHSATVHKVIFQAKPLIVDDVAKDDRDITLYYQD